MKKFVPGTLALAVLTGCATIPSLGNSQRHVALSASNRGSVAPTSPYLALAADVLTQYFHQADSDQSGTLNAAEFADNVMIGRLADFDSDQDEQVTLSEFKAQPHVEHTARSIHLSVEYAFPKLDADKDGKLSGEEMKRCSVSMGELDGNHDGNVTLKELETYDVAKERLILETAPDYFLVPRKSYIL